MTKQAHTPGPWHVVPGYGAAGIAGADNSSVAQVRHPAGPGCARGPANAHLIAAAPDLLSVSYAALEALEVYRAMHGPLPVTERAADQLVAAIAKAEGANNA